MIVDSMTVASSSVASVTVVFRNVTLPGAGFAVVLSRLWTSGGHILFLLFLLPC